MAVLNPIIERAYKVLSGQILTRDEALELAEKIHGTDLLDLISLANKVKSKFAGDVPPCSILNAKSGKCSQNCSFCAQSAAHHTQIETYNLVSPNEALAAARKVYESGVRTFGYVTSGYGYLEPNAEFQQILATLDLLHKELPELKICVSIGILSRECARMLSEHHTYRYNMNLQTNPAHYADLISTTHDIDSKIKTIKYLQEFGVTNCTGGIIGLGETWADRVDFALAIRDLHVEGSPLNVLLPIPGTKMQDRPLCKPAEVAKFFAIFRLLNPAQMIKFAAGRETIMKDFQGLLMLSGLNSLMTGGYLTTRGRSVADDEVLLEQLADF